MHRYRRPDRPLSPTSSRAPTSQRRCPPAGVGPHRTREAHRRGPPMGHADDARRRHRATRFPRRSIATFLPTRAATPRGFVTVATRSRRSSRRTRPTPRCGPGARGSRSVGGRAPLAHETLVHRADAALASGPTGDRSRAGRRRHRRVPREPAWPGASFAPERAELTGPGREPAPPRHRRPRRVDDDPHRPTGSPWGHGHGKGDVRRTAAAADLLLLAYGRTAGRATSGSSASATPICSTAGCAHRDLTAHARTAGNHHRTLDRLPQRGADHRRPLAAQAVDGDDAVDHVGQHRDPRPLAELHGHGGRAAAAPHRRCTPAMAGGLRNAGASSHGRGRRRRWCGPRRRIGVRWLPSPRSPRPL